VVLWRGGGGACDALLHTQHRTVTVIDFSLLEPRRVIIRVHPISRMLVLTINPTGQAHRRTLPTSP